MNCPIRALIAAIAISSSPAAANPQLALIEGARANMEVLDTRRVRGSAFDYDHAVTIALPASYHAQPDATYPVVWVLDDALMTRTVVGLVDILVGGNKMPEVIVIGVGSPSEEGLQGVGRRMVEFSPEGKGFTGPGLARETFERIVPLPEYPHRADAFLARAIGSSWPQKPARD